VSTEGTTGSVQNTKENPRTNTPTAAVSTKNSTKKDVSNK
jgi:hypothetical protein